jgi:hypothetical protein
MFAVFESHRARDYSASDHNKFEIGGLDKQLALLLSKMSTVVAIERRSKLDSR